MTQSVSDGGGPNLRHPQSPFARERKMQGELKADDGKSAEDEDEEEGEEEEEEEEGIGSDVDDARLPGYPGRLALVVKMDFQAEDDGERENDEDESEESDLGYQEDEEDGAFSEEDVTTSFPPGDAPFNKFAFARPTNYRRRRQRDDSPSTSPPPAPAILPPPARRGRGHIRVIDDPTHSGKEGKGCSRHVSPPPARSRSNSTLGPPPPGSSPSARKMIRKEKKFQNGRLSDAGPRDGRAGSPMPPRVLDLEGEDEGEDENNEPAEEEVPGIPALTPPKPRGGWRSDDSIFYGPNSQQTRGIAPIRLESIPRNVSAPPTRTSVFDDSDDEAAVRRGRSISISGPVPTSVPMEQQLSSMGVGDGVRKFLRRASEHLPLFRRPSAPIDPAALVSDESAPFVVVDPRELGITSMSTPMFSQATCPPALDDTPALAETASGRELVCTPLTRRLEKTLSAQTTVLNHDKLAEGNTSYFPTIQGDGQTQAQGINTGVGLTRATTLGGRVTFQPVERPHREVPPRTVSHVLSADEGAQRRARIANRVGQVRPIACPKVRREGGQDLGWTDEALLHIRRNVGKE
jgi:hypothetical protein